MHCLCKRKSSSILTIFKIIEEREESIHLSNGKSSTTRICINKLRWPRTLTIGMHFKLFMLLNGFLVLDTMPMDMENVKSQLSLVANCSLIRHINKSTWSFRKDGGFLLTYYIIWTEYNVSCYYFFFFFFFNRMHTYTTTISTIAVWNDFNNNLILRDLSVVDAANKERNKIAWWTWYRTL